MFVAPALGRVTFAAFYLDWSTRQVWAPGTRTAMSLAVRSVPFGNVQLRSLRRSHLEHWVKFMDDRGLAPGTIRTRYNNVRSVLKGAVADGVLAADPCAGVRLPRARKREAAMTIPTPADVGALLNAADDEFRPYLALCAFAGLRLGEAAAAQAEDVDWLRRSLNVTRQVQRMTGGTLDVRPPKYGSERVVHLPDEVVELLAAHVAAHPPTPWLFRGVTPGLPPHQNTVGHRWRQTCKRAGVIGFTLHDLRHFYASGLIAAGCDVVTVQRALGHAKATTTLNTYSHLWQTAEDRTRSAASALFAEATDEFLTNSPHDLTL
jgi:integrase